MMEYWVSIPPHLHAMYEGSEVVFDLGGNVLKGAMSPRAIKLTKEWANMHKHELEINWERAGQNEPLNWIEPLR